MGLYKFIGLMAVILADLVGMAKILVILLGLEKVRLREYYK